MSSSVFLRDLNSSAVCVDQLLVPFLHKGMKGKLQHRNQHKHICVRITYSHSRLTTRKLGRGIPDGTFQAGAHVKGSNS